MIGVAVFALSNLSFVSTQTPFSGRAGLEVFYIRTLVDLGGYAILFAQFERIQQSAMERELASIQASLEAQHHQYLSARADMEQVARAHHDLKHQVAAIRAELDPGRAAASFEELESQIARIGQQYHSGNPVLDVVLTTKGRVCGAEGINFTAVADGSLLAGMSSMDIATLFGNALDNAIEASRRVPDPAKRLIELALFRRGEMVVIRVDNWFDGRLSTDAGGRLTTIKADGVRHGWGVKSIQWTARKYGGQAATRAEDHWFTLTVLLPSASPLQER